MVRSKIKTLGIVAVLMVLSVLALYFAQALLMPKYMSNVKEGALIAEYYKAPKNNDVIFIGDCEVYENISPVTLWQEYGITSYIRGSAQQLIWQSYYLLEETLRYETPKVVVFNVLSMKYNEPQNEAYNRMTLDGMKWSDSKAASIRASMTEKESFISYVFPLLRFHSRWSALTKEDFRYMFSKDMVSYNGYLLQTKRKGVTTQPRKTPLADYSFGENAWDYLDKITQLCKEKNIRLVLMKAPTIYPVWYDEWEEQIKDYAAQKDLPYYNFLESIQESGIDLTTDTYDAGLHLNVWGAEKLSRYFGQILRTECDLPDHRQDSAVLSYWKNDMKQRKEQQIDEKILDNGAVYCSDRNFTCRLRHSIRQQCKKSAERLHFYHR